MIEFNWKFLSIALVCVLATGFTAPYASAFTINSNSLFIDDQGSQSVKLVNFVTSNTGTISNFATTNINGPRGIIFTSSPPTVPPMLVANQFPNTNQPGDIAKYDPSNGNFLGPLVSQSDPDAPHAPRGVVLSPDHNVLYVADFTETIPSQANTAGPGLIRTYVASGPNAGHFIASYSAQGVLRPSGDQFNPRGIVFGPDGLLYISVFDTRNPLTGYILTFNPSTSAFSILVASNAANHYASGIHRPEGIVFDPSGKSLWVTSFCDRSLACPGTNNVDMIMEFDLSGCQTNTACLPSHTIPLESSTGTTRTYAQVILFGPNLDGTNENLYVPIQTTGELRVYETSHNTFTSVQLSGSGSPLIQPWYLSFRGTDPSTLAYHPISLSALSSSPVNWWAKPFQP